ncbi:MAG: hypothetical protein RLZZ556_501 [Actinomycetota bacterium]|jgi:predicted metal-dependent phosphoesterase TrpH
MKVDLHIHSELSDGDDSIEQLVDYIADAGIDVFALTDHDRTDGWELAGALANKHGLSFIPGVEITTKGKFEPGSSFGIHLLAYLPDPNHPELAQLLLTNRQARDERMKLYVENLKDVHEELTLELVLKLAAAGSTLGRPDIARALHFLGKYDTVADVWASGILGKDTDYYVRVNAPEVRDVIKVVRAAGGVPVIAHPLARSDNDDGDAPSFFKRDHFIALVEAGLLGIETDHIEVSAERKIVFDTFAKEFDLITTGSSDYHGLKAKPNNPLGLRTTKLEQLKRILEKGFGSSAVINHSL